MIALLLANTWASEPGVVFREDFEDGEGWDIADWPSPHRRGVKVRVVDDEGREGTAGLRVRSSAMLARAWSEPFPVVAGTRLYGSAHVAGTGDYPVVGVWFRGEQLGEKGELTHIGLSSGPRPWGTVTGDVVVPDGAEEARIYVQESGDGGPSWLDDVMLRSFTDADLPAKGPPV